MNNIPISAGGPIKDSIGRGKRIAKKVVKTIEKPNYKSMIKEKKISIAKSLDNIIKKCEKTAVTIKKDAVKFGGFKDIVGPTKIKPPGDKPIFFDKKPGVKPITKGGFGSGRKPGQYSNKAAEWKIAEAQGQDHIPGFGIKPKYGTGAGFLPTPKSPKMTPITKDKADWQTPPFPPGSSDLIKPIKKSLDGIIEKCEKTAIKPIKKQFTTPSGKIPKYDPITHPHVEEKLGMKGGFHSHVGEKMHQISTPHLPKLSKAPEPITKRNLGRAGSMLNPFLERATESKKIYDPKLPPISPYTLPKSSYRNWGKTKQEYDKHLTKSSELQKAEDLIFLKADRLGHILSKDYEKVDDLTLVKGFGCIEKIPETIMKDEDGRPPKKWFDACLSRAGKWADDPAKACGALWHDPEKWDETKGEATKEAYGKSAEGVSKMVDPKGQKGEADIINPDKPKLSDLEPSEKNISS